MGDVASSLISASTEELLRSAASEEVTTLTNEYRLSLAQALFLSVLEEQDDSKESTIDWMLKRRTWKSFNRALHESWCWIKVPTLGKKWKKLYCVARPDYTFEAYETKDSYSSAAKPKYSLRPAGYCILHAAEQWKQLWTKRTAYLLQTETPKEAGIREKPSPADYTICLSHPIMEPLFIGVETPAEKEVWNLILGDFIRRTSELKAVDEIQKHALGAAVERTRKLHQWRDPDLVAAGAEIDIVYHVVAERLLGELGLLARGHPKLKFEKFSEKQRAIEAGFELVKSIARDVVLNGTNDVSYQKAKSDVEVEVRALRPMLVKELKRLNNHKLNKHHENGNILDAYSAMSIALGTLSPSIDLGLKAVKNLFCESVKELKSMIQRKPVYVNHVDIWFLRSMDPLSRDPLKLRPLLKSLVRLPRPAAASAYIHCQELLDSLVWTFENLVSEGSMRNNGRLVPDEVAKIEAAVLDKFEVDNEQLKRMLLAKWLLNEGRQRLPAGESDPGVFVEHDRRDVFMRPQLIQERVLLNKLRKHADELVSPKAQSVPEVKIKLISSIEEDPVIEALSYVKSEPPSPVPEVKSISFLNEVVEGTKGLDIDLTGSNFSSSFIPKTTESVLEPKPITEVTVTRSHTTRVNDTSSWKPPARPKRVVSPTIRNSFDLPTLCSISISSSERSSAPSNTLNLAQLQHIQQLTGIKPKEMKPKKKSTTSIPKIISPTISEKSDQNDISEKVAVNYREMDNRIKPIHNPNFSEDPPVNNASEVLMNTKTTAEGKPESDKPLVITAKITSPHVQALNERYVAQEAELQKADREREKKDLLEKGNSSAQSDTSLKSASFVHKPRGAKRQPSPKPRTEEWVQQHMNHQPDAEVLEQSDEQKLNDDYEKRKHLYENLPRSSPTPQGLSTSQPHLNLLDKRDNDLRSKSAAQATIISDMRLGSDPEIQHQSVESIPTKTSTRKKQRAKENRREITNDSTDDEIPHEAAELSVKSKSAILNESAIAGTIKRKKKKKRDKTTTKADTNDNNISSVPNKIKEQPQPAPSTSETKIKGFRDFNELQREMRERQKELKRKLKQEKKKKAEKEAIINKTSTKRPTIDETRISENSENDSDLPAKYIEESYTERQFVDVNGKVQTEVTKTEVVKTKNRHKSKSRSKISADGTTHTEHIDLATGIQDTVIKRTLKEKIREKERKSRQKSTF